MDNAPPPAPLVSPLNWLALAALLLLAGVWAFTGSIPRMVDGRGVVLRDSSFGIYEVEAPGDGTLARVLVTEGDVVAAGQPIAELRGRLEAGQFIRSARAGRVIEVAVSPGNVVRPGQMLLRLESLTGNYEGLVYVSALEGKKVREGMEARIVPSTSPAELTGYLRARVTYVSPQPVTRDYLVSELGGNDRLADWLLEQDNRTEVVVELIRDPGQPDGYAWSTGKPAARIESGLLLEGRVVFDQVRPIFWLFSPDRE